MKTSELNARVHLPDLIASTCGPDAVRGLNRDHGGVICDPRPGHEEHRPSFSVYRKDGTWKWKRHGGDDGGGSTFDFLLSLGYSPSQAREELARVAGVTLDGWQPASIPRLPLARDPLRAARWALDRCHPLTDLELRRLPALLNYLTLQTAAGREVNRRGLYAWRDLNAGPLRKDFYARDGRMLAHAGALAVLMRGPTGHVMAVKVRNLGTDAALQACRLDRYVYRIAGHGAPAWCSRDYGTGEAVLIVEGELNGAAASRALSEAGVSIDVQGLAGAGGTPFLEGLRGKVAFLYADPDAAGLACLERVGEIAQAAGAREVRVLAGNPDADFCDLLSTLGSEAFAGHLQALMTGADYWQTVFTGKTALRVKNPAQGQEKRLLANWQTLPGWGGKDASGWGGPGNAWGTHDQGGW